MYYTYILYSKRLQKYYCGSTSDIKNRLEEHNSGENKSTKHGLPWLLVGYLMFNKRAEALRKEKQIKGRGISRWLEYGEVDLQQLNDSSAW